MARSIWVVLIGICGAIAACHPQLEPIVPSPTDSVESPSVTPPPTSSLDPSLQQLQTLLAAQNWRSADQQTRLLMLKLSGRELEGWMDAQSLDRIGCDTLRAIDQDWKAASGGKFGFSVQRQVWQESENLEAMSDRVGWRQEGAWVASEALTFGVQAPTGHLPSGDGVGLWRDGMRVGRGFPLLAATLAQCGL